MCAIVCNSRFVYEIDFWYSPTYIQLPLRIFLTSQIYHFVKKNHYLLPAISSITLSNFPLIKLFANIYFFGNFKLMSILFFSSPRPYPSNHPLTHLSFQIHIKKPTVSFLSHRFRHYQSSLTLSFNFTIQCSWYSYYILQQSVSYIIIFLTKHFISYNKVVYLLWVSSNTFKTNFI